MLLLLLNWNLVLLRLLVLLLRWRMLVDIGLLTSLLLLLLVRLWLVVGIRVVLINLVRMEIHLLRVALLSVMLLLLLLLVLGDLVGMTLSLGMVRSVLRDGVGMNLVLTIWSRIISLWHIRMRRKLSLGNQSLDLLLVASFVFQIFLVRKLRLMIHGIPLWIFLELFPLSLLQEFIITDQPILVCIGFLEHVLPHPLHLLGPFLHIIFRNPSLVHLVQLVNEQHFYLILVPKSISINIVQHKERLRIKVLSIHMVLLLPYFLQLGLIPRMMNLLVLVMLLLLLLQLLFVLLPMFLV